MAQTSIRSVSHPFWAELLSLTGMLVPNAISYAETRPESPPTARKATSSHGGLMSNTGRPATQRYQRAKSDRMHKSESITRETRSRAPGARYRTLSSIHSIVDSVNDETPPKRVLTAPHTVERYEENVKHNDVQAEDVVAKKPIRSRIRQTLNKCKQLATGRERKKDEASRNRDSQQYVAEWVQEVHSAIDEKSTEVEKDTTRKSLGTRLTKLRCLKFTGRKDKQR